MSQAWSQKARAEGDDDGGRKKQGELEARQAELVYENGGCCRKEGVQVAEDQTDRKGRKDKT